MNLMESLILFGVFVVWGYLTYRLYSGLVILKDERRQLENRHAGELKKLKMELERKIAEYKHTIDKYYPYYEEAIEREKRIAAVRADIAERHRREEEERKKEERRREIQRIRDSEILPP